MNECEIDFDCPHRSGPCATCCEPNQPSSDSSRPVCSTLWRLRFIMPNSKATVWLTVDGPFPLKQHTTAFNMGFCTTMDYVASNDLNEGSNED